MKLKLHTLLFGCMLTFGAINAQTTTDSYVPLTVGGFTQDVIVNGSGAATTSATMGVDNARIAFLSTDYVNGTKTAPATALPANGTLTSLLNASLKYQLAPYTGNNSLRLQNTNDTGEITLAGIPSTALATKALNVLTTGGSGAVTFSYIVTFTDNSTQTGTGTAGDWVSGTGNVAYSGFSRISLFDDAITTASGTPKMFQTTITLDAANQSKTVSKIKFTKTSTAEGTLHVFAVTATLGVCTPPTTPQADAQNFCTASKVSDLVARGAVTGGTYVWFDSVDATTPLDPATALKTGTYYVAQKVSSCIGNKWSISVTVTDLAAPTAAADQPFCTYATISELAKAGATGVNFHYYLATDLTKELGFYEPLINGESYVITQSLGQCTSPGTTVKISISTTPQPVVANQLFCDSAKVTDLKVVVTTGASAKWYATANAKTSLFTGEPLTSGIYYVTQTINDCESIKLPFEVTISSTPVVGGDAEQSFAANATVANIVVTTTGNNTVTWYTKNTAGDYVAIPTTTPLVDGATYYAQQNSASCPSAYYPIKVTVAKDGDGDGDGDGGEVGGTESFKFKNLIVYPNPAQSIVTVSNNDVINHITVTNLLGQTVISQAVNGTVVPVNVEQLATGTYLLQVQSLGSTATLKIVKQ